MLDIFNLYILKNKQVGEELEYDFVASKYVGDGEQIEFEFVDKDKNSWKFVGEV